MKSCYTSFNLQKHFFFDGWSGNLRLLGLSYPFQRFVLIAFYGCLGEGSICWNRGDKRKWVVWMCKSYMVSCGLIPIFPRKSSAFQKPRFSMGWNHILGTLERGCLMLGGSAYFASSCFIMCSILASCMSSMLGWVATMHGWLTDSETCEPSLAIPSHPRPENYT